MESQHLALESGELRADGRRGLVFGREREEALEVGERGAEALEPLVHDSAVAQLERCVGLEQQDSLAAGEGGPKSADLT